MSLAVEIIGWAGAGLILAAYLLISSGRLTGQSPLFQWMNALGAAGFIVNTAWHQAWPSTALNVVWITIALVALIRIARGKRATPN